MEDPIEYDCIWPGLYLYLPHLQDLILYLSSKPPRFGASWPVSLGPVGRLMEGPLFLSTNSKRCGTLGTKLRQQPPSAWQASLVFLSLAKLSSALSNLDWFVWVLPGSDRVLTPLTKSLKHVKMRLGAPNRCSPWLPNQIPLWIDSGVKS
jgi:hypothetical protein